MELQLEQALTCKPFLFCASSPALAQQSESFNPSAAIMLAALPQVAALPQGADVRDVKPL